MTQINLKFGADEIPFTFDESRFDVIETTGSEPSLSDAELNEKFEHPICSPQIEDIVKKGETVLIVVPDATREVACGQVINLLVRRLIANGTTPFEISIIFATGIHRKVTDAESQSILTPFIAQRIKTIDHAPRDLMQIVRLGETTGGIPIELNRALLEHKHVILIGGIGFHYFAGFTGGRKLVCPGLASTKTIVQTHKLAFDFETKNRREGVESGKLEGNTVHEAFVEITKKIAPAFCISTIVDDKGDVVDMFCGDWIESHEVACAAYKDFYTVTVEEKREVVVVGCGGLPHDLNLIQAHKAMEAASHICVDGGTIILIAKCDEGLGRDDFLKWFAHGDSSALATELCNGYQVNGQTAWSLLKKAERFNVVMVTDLPENVVGAMKMKKAASFDEAFANYSMKRGFVLPFGAKISVELKN